MELLQLRYFCTVARLQNISQAAAFHEIPQPAMSKTISKLEKELGAELFARRKNRIYLTEAGQQFYEQVFAALHQLDEAVGQLRRPQSTQAAHLHLLVTALRGRTAEVLALFRRSYPNVTFTVSSTMESGADSGGYDLCISDQPPADVYDGCIPLAQRQVDLYAAMAPNHPLARRQLIGLEELRDEPTVRISTSPLQNPVAELCKAHGFMPKVVISCDDLQCLQRYIRAGTGIAITAPYSWPDMGDTHIRFVKVDAKLSQQISIYWQSGRAQDEVWHALVRMLRQYFDPTASFWQAVLE